MTTSPEPLVASPTSPEVLDLGESAAARRLPDPLPRNPWPLMLAVDPPKKARPVVISLGFAFVAFAATAAFAPWQQTVLGSGQVVAFAPSQRQQSIDATISGRIDRFLVEEGQTVKAGDPIAELKDNDPELFSRLASERATLEMRRESLESRVLSLFERVGSLERSQRAQVENAEAEVHIAIEELSAVQQKLLEAQAELEANATNDKRHDELMQKGLVSSREQEVVRLARQKSEASLTSAQANVRAAEAKLRARKAALERVKATTRADVESALASLRDAETDVQSTKAALIRMEVEISRQEARMVTAPVDGTILRVMARTSGQQVSRGEALAILVPNTDDRSVALYVDGNDASLIEPGAKVRLQFEGWPAVQFSGWPSVAVGTFGGVVSFIDQSDDGEGNFRVVVTADKEDYAWPSASYLRQGVRAKGWFLLKKVTIGFELWRRFNGFPPTAPRKPLLEELRERGGKSDLGKADDDQSSGAKK